MRVISTITIALSLLAAGYVGSTYAGSGLGPGIIKYITPEVTAEIVSEIENSADECYNLALEYRASCMVAGLNNSAQAVRNRNLSDGQATLSGKNGSYRAVKSAQLAQVNRQAAAIVEEAATKLIRSSGRAGQMQVHYATVAEAVDSSKRLFRS
jgi:hypothetical protein